MSLIESTLVFETKILDIGYLLMLKQMKESSFTLDRKFMMLYTDVMKKQKRFKEALDFIKTRRYVANPNSGFRLQLSAFERRILHADCLIPPENSYIATATTSERGEI